MKALTAWLSSSAAAHLAGVVGLVVLLATGTGPQAEEMAGLALLLGIALPQPSGPTST